MGSTLTNVLGRVERLLSGLVEGTAERWFKPRLQPVHLARRLETAMEEGVLVGVHGPLAPNSYLVALDPATYGRFSGALAGIQRDLERHLVAAAARRRLRTLDPFLVEIRADPALSERRFTVQAAFLGRSSAEQGVGPKGEAGQVPGNQAEHTMVMPLVAADTVAEALAVLEVLGPKGSVVCTVPLTGDRWTVGRAADNTLVIPEQAVSRHHAAIRRSGGQFVVEDLESTNGLLVNGRPVRNAPLADGDRLLIGTAELVFRQQTGLRIADCELRNGSIRNSQSEIRNR